MREMARLRGFEPLTYGLEVRCSIQLSHRRTKLVGVRGFEPPAPCSQGRCASQAALHPDKDKLYSTVSIGLQVIFKPRIQLGYIFHYMAPVVKLQLKLPTREFPIKSFTPLGMVAV
jgi:hypothetical protein